MRSQWVSLIAGMLFLQLGACSQSSSVSRPSSAQGSPASTPSLSPTSSPGGSPSPSASPSGSPSATATPSPTFPPNGWRSSLYPENWTPGYTDSSGRFLHDFSYAGYHRQEAPIPTNPPGSIIDVTQPPYLADNTGSTDTTTRIQNAINEIQRRGGGIVYLPSGTYKVSPQGSNLYALWISASRVVIRGAGANQTFIFNDSTDMRFKRIFHFGPFPDREAWWWENIDTGIRLTQDLRLPTKAIPVENTSPFRVGEKIVIRSDATAEFIADHQMTGAWTSDSLLGPAFHRTILSIDSARKVLNVDIPTRYYLLLRDNARVYHTQNHLEEVGLEGLSIGMRQVPLNELDDNQYDTPGTTSYRIHVARAVMFNMVLNGWIRNVTTYKPSVNTDQVHLLSNGISVSSSRNVTVQDCDFRYPNYKGAGGNGYMFIQQGSDNLFKDLKAVGARHNFSHSLLLTTGNVILRGRAEDSRLPSDFHMYLSPANLIDSLSLDKDYIGAFYRDTATPRHGHGTTQSVFWNIKGDRPQSWSHRDLIESEQWAWGYVIGTSGQTNSVSTPTGYNTAPADFVEGRNQGGTLYPPSLFEDQVRKRLGP